ncbi:MAG: DUF2254 domain-containing protein [Gaiellaceae bacterium]
MRRFRIVHAFAQRLWIIPSLGVLTGIVLSLVTVAIDRRNENGLLSQSIVGNAADAQSILTTIATAVVTLTSIVLTVTLVAVQLAMGQFSPRIVRALLDDRGDQIAIAVFGATFTFAVFSLRAVDTGPGAAVPGVTVLTALALAAASAFALLAFVHHASQQLRVGALVDLVGDELRSQLDRRFPRESDVREDTSVLPSRRSGNLIHCDRDALVAEARRAGCTLELVPMMGDFVIRGAPLVRVQGDGARLDRERVRQLIALDSERTHTDDPAYGFRKLVDVAQRALGTAANDATTAVQVVNRLQDCLRQIADRPFPNGHVRDEDDELRLIERVLDWDGYVRLAFDEIRLAAGGYPQVTRRLEAALTDLKTVAPAQRQPALDRQLRLLERGVAQALEDEDDRRAALVADAQGIGSGADVAVR